MQSETDAKDGNAAAASEDKRHAAAQALGLDLTLIPRAGELETAPVAEAAEPPERQRLSDAEWDSLAPLLPPEMRQASSMTNREFLEAVLEAMRYGGRWTSRHTPAKTSESVRRRFGRWAHLGVFQALAAKMEGLALSSEHRRLLTLAGRRAAHLKRRAAR